LSLSKNKAAAIALNHPYVSVHHQCPRLGINRSTVYYQPKTDSEEELQLTKCIDVMFTMAPFYGVRRMTWMLQEENWPIGRKKVTRFMREMGLVATYPKQILSKANVTG
jgi:putative transposase